MKKDMPEPQKSLSSGLDEWKLKYIKEGEIKDKEITDLKNRLLDATENKRIHYTPINGLNRDCYVDSVHFNELGNQVVAEAFAKAILER